MKTRFRPIAELGSSIARDVYSPLRSAPELLVQVWLRSYPESSRNRLEEHAGTSWDFKFELSNPACKRREVQRSEGSGDSAGNPDPELYWWNSDTLREKLHITTGYS
ncbi:hypothetical protein I7I51_06711 [Histoplasma capsulatum]|uniref:Uncharacterized protein n=1 Tax=Ajellomyces capsulatus TaxID=5037 RepID=A0A8A1ML43_AJECA|nr:hypothetical protein I7I51_06711 [Histoplasma capsulatum]